MSTFKKNKEKIRNIRYITGRKKGRKGKGRREGGRDFFLPKVPDFPSKFRRPLKLVTCSTFLLCVFLSDKLNSHLKSNPR